MENTPANVDPEYEVWILSGKVALESISLRDRDLHYDAGTIKIWNAFMKQWVSPVNTVGTMIMDRIKPVIDANDNQSFVLRPIAKGISK